jgi:hypothetical protein
MALKPSHSPPNLAWRVSISAGSGLEHAVDLVAPVSTGSTCGCRWVIGRIKTCSSNIGTTSIASQCTRLTDIRESRRHETGIATVSARPTSLHCIAAVRINHVVVVTQHSVHQTRRRLTVDAGVVGEGSVARPARDTRGSRGSRGGGDAVSANCARDGASCVDCRYARWHETASAVILAVFTGNQVLRRARIARIREFIGITIEAIRFEIARCDFAVFARVML